MNPRYCVTKDRLYSKGGETIEEKKLCDLKHDIVFQELFGKQKNSDITAHLLSLILEKDIKNINLDVNKRMLGNRIDSKTGRLDIRAKFNNGEDCNIELQVLPYPYMNKRMLEYWSSMYLSKISSGNAYEILKPSISILIANYNLNNLKDIPKYHTKWNLRESTYHDKILLDDIEMHILEIPKISTTTIETDELALWLKFIENSKSMEVQKFMEKKENKYLKQALEELEYLSGDPDFQRLVEAREGFLRDQHAFEISGREQGLTEGLSIGKEQGLEIGRKEKQLEIAKKLLKLGVEVEKIISATGLTEEEIKDLSE